MRVAAISIHRRVEQG
jgi:hypothetical protein